MSFKKFLSLLIAITLTGAFLTGCTSTGNKDSSDKPVRFGQLGEPETLDPRKATGQPEGQFLLQMYEGLTAYDADNNAVPAAAEKWEVSADGLTYTFHIRQNAKWSNGDQVTAQDFEYAWKTLLSPEIASRYAEMLFYLKNGEAYNSGKVKAEAVGVKAVDPNTLEVTLEAPTPYFPQLTACYSYFPVHKKTVENNADRTANPETIISNGPFKLTAWSHNEKAEFVKNENYWDAGKVKAKKLEFSIVESNTTRVSLFENDQIDLTLDPPPSDVERLIKEKKAEITPHLGTYYYSFEVEKAPFNNPKVRKALTLAIDRSAIVKEVTKAKQIPAGAFVPLGIPDAAKGSDFRNIGGDYFKDNDIETAKKLLAEAGYPDGKGLPPITLTYNTHEGHKAIAEALQEMWKKNLGVQVELTNQEWKVFLKTCAAGDFQIARDGWSADFPDPMTFLSLFVSNNGNNHAHWKNAQFDQLVSQAKTTTAPASRVKIMHEAEALLMEEMPVLPIYFYTMTYMIKPNVKGFVHTVTDYIYFKEAYVE
ncbi:MAG: peptide ABC transporter substrate-binding protein [Pelosinus sp.]|nr:peptide ABC transporter substrate-binding protein [Pelosinus sp.]